MRIGIKYCGGCNPRYNRREFVETLMDELKGKHDFQIAKSEITYDTLLVLGGCGNCCPNYKDIQTKYGEICVTDKNDYQKTLNLLEEMESFE